MFGWLFPRPPLDVVEKAWTERSMLRLSRQWGLPRMLGVGVSLPGTELVGESCDGTLESGQCVMTHICEHLTLDPNHYRLEVATSACDDHAAPQPEPGVVLVSAELLEDGEALTATLAHELARELLPPEARPAQSLRESDWLVDLAAVYWGLGLHVAHAVIRSTTSQGSHACHCGPRRIQHLPARMVGYAMALFAHVRGEARPEWDAYLQLDALVAYRSGLRYLRRTGDTLFTANTAGSEPRPAAADELLRQLNSGTGSARVAALWDLRDVGHASAAADAVTRCLHDRAPAIREEAARTVAEYGVAGKQAISSLVELLHEPKYSIRAAAARALGILGNDSLDVLEHLAPLLGDPDPHVVLNAAEAVRAFGSQGEIALPYVLAALRSAMIRCDHPLIDAITRTLFALDPDPTDRVMQFFEDDPELREQTVHVIVDALHGHDDKEIA